MLVILVGVQAAISVVLRAIGPLGPFLQDEWGLSVAQVGLLQSAVFFGQVLGGIPAGGLSDRLGVRRTLLVSGLVVGAFYLVMLGTNVYALAAAALVCAGVGQVMMHGTANKGILQWFPPERRGLAVGIKQSAVSLGSGGAALLIPPLAVLWGWKPAMLLMSAGLILLAVVGYVRYQELADGSTSGKRRPLDLRSLIRHRPLWRLSSYAFLMGAIQMSVSSYLVLYLTSTLRLSEIASGALLALLEAWGIVGRIGWGTISDRWFLGRREVVLRIMALIAIVAMVGLAETTGPGSSPLWVGFWVFLAGISAVGFHGLWMTLASEMGRETAAATATGFSLTMGSMGITVGTPLVGTVIDLTGSYRYGWLTCAALGALALLVLHAARLDPYGESAQHAR